MDTSTHTVEVDGYDVGDRLLEGVVFRVTVTLGPGPRAAVGRVETAPAHAGYVTGLDEPRWHAAVARRYSDFPTALEAVGQTLDDDAWDALAARTVQV